MNQTPAPRTLTAGRGGSASGNPKTQDNAFIDLLNGYRPHGGLFRQHHPTFDDTNRYEGSDCNDQDLFNTGDLFGFD